MASATPVVAEAPFLEMPLDCQLGKTCVIEDYPDVDPGPGASDYRCGLKARDAHSGTDFALPDFAAMEKGVSVLAAAAGRVEAIRNTLPDQPYVPGTDLNGKECGNAVRINHNNGYVTVYCHMKLGSVRVSPGQRVLAGQVLGEVGLSGKTNYPHLHLTVVQGDKVIDPFDPDQTEACGEPAANLWLSSPAYLETGLFTAGVSDRVPDMEEVQSGSARLRELASGDAMVLYGYAFHAQPGDVMRIEMRGPGGEVFAHTATLEQDQAQLFRAFGRRPPSTGWPVGDYRGYVTLLRGDTLLAVRHADVDVQ